MATNEPLRPCPLATEGIHFVEMCSIHSQHPEIADVHNVYCSCGLSGPIANTAEDAANQWNARTPTSPHPTVEDLKPHAWDVPNANQICPMYDAMKQKMLLGEGLQVRVAEKFTVPLYTGDQVSALLSSIEAPGPARPEGEVMGHGLGGCVNCHAPFRDHRKSDALCPPVMRDGTLAPIYFEQDFSALRSPCAEGWQGMESAPRDGSEFLAKLKWYGSMKIMHAVLTGHPPEDDNSGLKCDGSELSYFCTPIGWRKIEDGPLPQPPTTEKP